MIIKWTNRQQHSSSQGLLLIIGKVHGHVQISHFLSVLEFTSTSLWSVCWYLVHQFGQWAALLPYLWITECATYGWQKKLSAIKINHQVTLTEQQWIRRGRRSWGSSSVAVKYNPVPGLFLLSLGQWRPHNLHCLEGITPSRKVDHR